jgi:alpha-D-ribose 1-methylphosphonate 5-triphosphate synthase subunit PhnH
MSAQAFAGAFADPSRDAARAFRKLLEAMAQPGSIHAVAGVAPPAPLSAAAAVVLLTLAGPETTVHLAGGLDAPQVRDWIAFHLGALLGPAEAADLAVGRWADLAPVARFRMGEPAYPDRSATLIVELDRLEAAGARLTGPGVRDAAWLSLPEIDAFRENRARFPLGFDCVLTCGARLAALPRTTRVEAA